MDTKLRPGRHSCANAQTGLVSSCSKCWVSEGRFPRRRITVAISERVTSTPCTVSTHHPTSSSETTAHFWDRHAVARTGRLTGVASLGRFSVLPLYGQVQVYDPGCRDFPVPETGDEDVVSSDQCIVVATQSDVDGRVNIEVRSDGELDGQGWKLVFDGELLLTEPRLVIGNYVANDVHEVSTSAGLHQLRVWTRSEREHPNEVAFQLS